MLNIKTKLIPAVMGISMIGSTGLASVVHACPATATPVNSKPAVVHRVNYSDSDFVGHLKKLVAEGVINNSQESKVLGVYNSGKELVAGLDALVSAGVITSYQETQILDYTTSSTHRVAPEPAKHIAPAPATKKATPAKAPVPAAKKVVPAKATTPATKNVTPAKAATPVPDQLPVNAAK